MNRSTGLRAAVLLLLVATVIAGCSGVPTSSPPQTVKAIGFGDFANPVPGPPRGGDPRTIVDSFLEANRGDPLTLASAREFLTPAARKTWSPASKATVIALGFTTRKFTSKGTVTVTGHALGTLNADGAYTPSFDEAVKFTFRLESVNGQYRISNLQDGLIISEDLFNRYYSAHPIYFYDAADQYLVPYVRYSALADPNQLANWLLNRLASPPEPQNVISPENLPTQAHRLTATLASLTTVQVAGSAQLNGAARNRLAAQVSQTLASVTRGSISIVDGRVPVRIPATRSAVFSASDFVNALGPAGPPVPEVNYLVGGRIVDQNGKRLAGAVNDGHYSYDSVALARRASGDSLAVAAVVGAENRQQLLVGTTQSGVRPIAIPRGALSRPAWAPGRSEVWVGDGAQLIRVDTSGGTPVARQVATPSAAGGGRIVALRLSPDGARIAMVLSGSHRSGQLYIGSVVRGAGSPQVVNLQPISPDGVVITDVAWNYALRLTAIGYLASSGDSRVFEVGVDGAEFDERGITGLPAAPLSLTATTDALAWVSADGFVWTQNGGSWISPGPTGQVPGDNPVYLS
jgi:hypothetical protein